LRLVLAIVSFLLAAAMLAFGIVQRTILAPPSSVELSVATSGSAPLTVIEGSTLQSHSGRQTIKIDGDDAVTAAYGRTSDVYAWIGDASYNLVTVDPATGQLVTTVHSGAENSVPSIADSDLWYDDYQDTRHLQLSVTLPSDDALLIAADGTEPAPSHISISWPLDDSTPWTGPLIIGGAVLLIFGLVMLLIAIYRIRTRHGPKRKMPKVPKQKTIRSVRPAARTSTKSGSLGAIVVLLAVGALAVPAASSPARADDTPSPTPTGDATAAPSEPVPAVTTSQLDRIVDRVEATIGQADSTLDPTVAATRMTGPALQLKTADYALKSKDANATPDSPAIPADAEVKLELPQQVSPTSDTWPRSVMVVLAPKGASTTSSPTPDASGDATAAPSSTPDPSATATPSQPFVVLVLQQATARDNYKVDYFLTLQAPIPEVAAPTTGAAVLAPDSALLSMSPKKVAAAYADVLANDTASASASAFDLSADNLAKAWGKAAQAAEQQKQAALASPNNVAYTTAAGADDLIALATTDAGALVTATVQQAMTVTPGEAGAKVIAQGDVLTLSGVDRSDKGYDVTYGGQVLFYVPALGTSEPITVLAYAQGLLSAQAIQ